MEVCPMRNIFYAFIILTALFFVFVVSSVVNAADINFAWDANTEADLAGYKIHAGSASGTYDQTVDVENVTAYTWSGFSDGEWFFAATAYDTAGNESDFSNEVSLVIDTAAPGSPVNFKATIEANRVTVETVE